jgi:hypothetical protein
VTTGVVSGGHGFQKLTAPGVLTMPRNAKNSVDFDKIWLDDAATIAERDRIAASGFRMPAAGKPATDPAATRPTNANPRRIVTTKRRPVMRPGIVAMIATVVLIVAAGVVWSRRPVVTLAEFEQLADGLTVEQCNAIVGVEGTTAFNETLPDFTTTIPTSAAVVVWTNANNTTASAAFVNGRLISKMQIGLR